MITTFIDNALGQYIDKSIISFNLPITAITLVALMYIPRRLRLWEPSLDLDDENTQLLKQMTGFKRRRAKKNQ